MKRLKKSLTSNLIKGAGSVLNIFPGHRKPRGLTVRFKKTETTVRDAIFSDFKKIGQDFAVAIDTCRDENAKSK